MRNDDQLDEKTDTTELDDRLESGHMTSHHTHHATLDHSVLVKGNAGMV